MRDEAFIRGKVPMTKMEVRAASLAYLNLYSAKALLDVGAGTGSVCIEALLRQPQLKAVAIERNEEGVSLIRENAVLHGVDARLTVIAEYAPCDLEQSQPFDRVFIGGTGGKLREILEWLKRGHLTSDAIVVVNAIAIESLSEAVSALEDAGFKDVEGSMIQASRLDMLGKYHYFKPLNPCYVIKGVLKDAAIGNLDYRQV